MYVKASGIVLGMLMERGEGLDLLNIRNDGMQPARSGWLRPDDLSDL